MNNSVIDSRNVQPISCDILVVGGGAAGLAAAVTASRAGKKVVMLERYGFSGGGAVAGLSGTVCGLYLATDAQSAVPEQVVHGFTGEFCRTLDSVGGLTGPIKYGKTWTRVHDPLKWREVSDGLLRQSGVQVIYHSVAVGVLIEGESRVEGVMAWTKQGLLRINAKLVVDASGDADVVAMAGWKDTIGDNGRVQNPTMIFTLQGVDVERFSGHYGVDSIMNESVSQLIRDKNSGGEYVLPRSKIWLFPTTQPNELLCNSTRICGDDGRELNSLYYQDFTEAEMNGRAQAREYSRFFKDHIVGCESAYLSNTAPQVGIAQVKRIVERGARPATAIRVPGMFVDALVVDAEMLSGTDIDSEEAYLKPVSQFTDLPAVPFGPDKVIARRAAQEVRKHELSIFGFGAAADIPLTMVESGVLDPKSAYEDYWFTTEHGSYGGVVMSGCPCPSPDTQAWPGRKWHRCQR
jgi:hypothetical protein